MSAVSGKPDAEEPTKPIGLSCNDEYYWTFGMFSAEAKRRIVEKYAWLERLACHESSQEAWTPPTR